MFANQGTMVVLHRPVQFPLKTKIYQHTIFSCFFGFICRILPRCKCRRLLYYGIVYCVACFVIIYILDIKINQDGDIPPSEQLQDAVRMKSSACIVALNHAGALKHFFKKPLKPLLGNGTWTRDEKGTSVTFSKAPPLRGG